MDVSKCESQVHLVTYITLKLEFQLMVQNYIDRRIVSLPLDPSHMSNIKSVGQLEIYLSIH